MSGFKSFTAARLIGLPVAHKAERLPARLRFYKPGHKKDREYPFRQEGAHSEMIFSEPVMREKPDDIHQNPVKRGSAVDA